MRLTDGVIPGDSDQGKLMAPQTRNREEGMWTEGKGLGSAPILSRPAKCVGGGEHCDGIVRTEITPGLGSRESRSGHAGVPPDRRGPGLSLLWEVQTTLREPQSGSLPVLFL